jgi:hypothetical protein
MKKELTESEVIDIIGLDEYQKFALQIYDLIKKNEEYNTEIFQSGKNTLFYLGFLQIGNNMNLHYEASLKRKTINFIKADDFGFERFTITNDIDYTLDRINEYKKTKDRFGFL